MDHADQVFKGFLGQSEEAFVSFLGAPNILRQIRQGGARFSGGFEVEI